MSKHTPGPWKATYAVGCWWIHQPVDGNGKPDDATTICRMPGLSEVTAAADATLIAAAPDLLAALQAVISVADRATDEFYMARAAIAKATG